MAEISIIVPVYNVESYIHRCVKSILSQTMTQLEIVLVDDGSTDKSGEICEEYKALDSRIKVIHQENGGLSAARNAGVMLATAEYVIFIDSDDYIARDMVETLYHMAKKNNADMSVCGVYNVYGEKIYPQYSREEEFVCTGREAFRHILEGKRIPGTVCNKLIKRKIAAGIQFPVGRLYEDAFYTLELVQQLGHVCVTTRPMYYYVHRPGSITTSKFRKADLDIICAYRETMELVREKYPEFMSQAAFRLLWAHFVVVDRIFEIGDYKKNIYFRRSRDFLRKNIFRILTNPYFSWKRKLAAVLLCIHTELYRKVLTKNGRQFRKVCFVDYDMSVTGGVEQVTANLANELSKYCEVHVVSILQGGEGSAYRLNDNIHYCAFFGENARLRKYIARGVPRLKRYLKENSIDVAFLMGNYPGIISIFAKFFVKSKFVFCDHGALMNQWEQKDVRYMRYVTSRLADRTVTLTRKSMEDYIEKFHLKEQKVEYIYNWLEKTEDTISYSTESKKILSVGRFGKEKGYDMLLKVAKKVLHSYPDWEWHIFGEGETFAETVEESRRQGLEGRVVFHGNQPDISRQFGEYAMLVLTSYREGLPLVLLEGKANKLPLVSFDVQTGPSEIIESGVNGYLIEPYNMEDMSDKIIGLIEDELLRKQFSDMAWLDIAKFEKENVLQKWLILIENMCGK